jgi:phospholipase/carboxylesterase
MADIQDRTFSARLDCHYLLLAPPAVDAKTPLVLTLHGFGGNAETMLQLTVRLFDAQPVIAALQGPYQFFRDPDAHDVGYGWITNRHPSESIRLHHEMVLHVAEAVGREFGISPDRRVLVGFSQSVSLNYRFGAAYPDAIRAVIGICGGLPGDWDTGMYQPVTAAVLHIARLGDQHYPPDITQGYAERLRRRAADVEFQLIDGSHQMPSGGARIVAPWLRRILA